MSKVEVTLSINGRRYTDVVEPRRTLADFIRHNAGLTGTHLGCEHGVCGACTVLVDGASMRSCLAFAVQMQGTEILTVESMASDGELNEIQQAFWAHHGLQCGFCTPGILLTTQEFLQEQPDPTDEQIRARLSGNLCRCTGYHFIVESVRDAAQRLSSETGAAGSGPMTEASVGR